MPTANLTMLTDFYELTMMQGYFANGIADKLGVFDLFYRQNPFGNGFAVMAGLEQVIEYVNNLRFDKADVDYLSGLGQFDAAFLDYLRDFRFTGDIHAMPEGEIVFPFEPLVRVTAPIIQAQLLETALLNIINHQCLIATKAARICYAAGGDAVLEFGLRRAQGPDAGVLGARAGVIGGCDATSNVLAGQLFDVPVRGTHAHSWVMSFPSELEAFRAYARTFPDACLLLVDTYDSLGSGVPNAITVFGEMRRKAAESGAAFKNFGIRLDSGDIAYLSKEARKMLDGAGFQDAIISASGDLDEFLIRDLKLQGAAVTVWGIGTRLITAYDCPALGGVYKLAAESGVKTGGGANELTPKIKISNNPQKITNPGVKKVMRLYEKSTGKIKADLITLDHEEIDENADLTIFDPNATWRRMTLKAGRFYHRPLLRPIFIGGAQVYESPPLRDIAAYFQAALGTLWDEHKRIVNPHVIPVDLSDALWELKRVMIDEIQRSKRIQKI